MNKLQSFVQSIFLDYVNAPFQDNPRSFYDWNKKIFTTLSGHHIDGFDEPTVERYLTVARLTTDMVAEKLVKSGKDSFKIKFDNGDPDCQQVARDIKRTLKKKAFKNPKVIKAIEDIYAAAFRAAYGFIDYKKPCYLSHGRKFFLDKPELFEGSNRLKCYECDQIILKKILEDVIGGVDYELIDHFESFMFMMNNCIRTRVETLIGESTDKGNVPSSLGRTYYPSFDLTFDNRHEYDPLRKFIISVNTHSLCEFLLHNDRGKIKRCPYCGTFFIARDKKKIYCYAKECERTYQRLKKQKQREEEPEYYK